MKVSKKSLLAGPLLSVVVLNANASLSSTPEESIIRLVDPEMRINSVFVPFDPTSPVQRYANYGGSVVITLGSLPSVAARMIESSGGDEFGGYHTDARGTLEYQVAVTSSKPDPIFVSVLPKKSTFVETTVWPDNGEAIAYGTASAYFMMKDSFGHPISYGLECVGLVSTYYISTPEDCAPPDVWPDIKGFYLMMSPNTPYSITLEARAVAGASPGNQTHAYAYIDPIFSFAGDAPSDAKFIYSPGVSQYVDPPNEVSEPTSVALLAGSAVLGLLSRRRKP